LAVIPAGICFSLSSNHHNKRVPHSSRLYRDEWEPRMLGNRALRLIVLAVIPRICCFALDDNPVISAEA
ncbi:MAG TPA: hypothetical protein VGN16_08465, partial [Acidobacteriaceae bacterium]